MNIISVLKQKIKLLWKLLVELYGAKEDIHSDEDCNRVKKWNKRVLRLFVSRSILAVIIILFILISLSTFEVGVGVQFLGGIIFVPLAIVTGWGTAAMKLYRKEVRKSIFKAALTGYKIGEQFETTHYTIKQEFNDTYSVSSHTTNDGCLYAAIFAGIRYMIWITFCVYVAPYLIFKKYKANLEEIKRFSES